MNLRILCVDDEAGLRNGIKRLYKGNGTIVYEAKNGIEGIEIARTQRPDVILLDCQMPGMDGIECYRHLRKDPELKAIPVVATGTFPEEMLPSFPSFVTKPFVKTDLDTAIAKALGRDLV